MIRRGNGFGHGFEAGSHHWIGAIAMIALWAALVIAIVVLVVWLVRSRHHMAATVGGAGVVGGGAIGTGETPLDILKSRYARGEIDKAEFDEKKKDLST